MSRKPTAAEIGDRSIEMAACYGKPSAGVGGIDGHFILNVPRTRDVPLPEPVTTDMLNGREPEAWEERLIVAARERERRIERALLAGTMGDPSARRRHDEDDVDEAVAYDSPYIITTDRR